MTVFAFCANDTIAARQQALEDEFRLFDDWAERYQYLVELGESLPAMPPALKIPANRIEDCRGETWLAGQYATARLHLHAASDTPVISGLLVMVLRVYSGQRPQDILRNPPLMLERIGLVQKFTPHRRLALLRIHERLIALALHLAVKEQRAS